MLRLAASASALALLSSMAVAADLPTFSPPPAPMLSTTPIAYNWSGFYIGAHGGWGFGDGAFDDGFVVGGQLGVNWQFNSFVLGAEGDGSFVDCGSVDSLARSACAAVSPSTGSSPTAPAASPSRTSSDVGWVAGGGVEYAFTDNVSAGVEYLHYDFDGDTSEVIRGRVNVTFNSLSACKPVSVSSKRESPAQAGLFLCAANSQLGARPSALRRRSGLRSRRRRAPG